MEIKRDEVMKNFTLSLDMKQVQKECFGIFKWRLAVSMFLVKTASLILRVPYEVVL